MFRFAYTIFAIWFAFWLLACLPRNAFGQNAESELRGLLERADHHWPEAFIDCEVTSPRGKHRVKCWWIESNIRRQCSLMVEGRDENERWHVAERGRVFMYDGDSFSGSIHARSSRPGGFDVWQMRPTEAWLNITRGRSYLNWMKMQEEKGGLTVIKHPDGFTASVRIAQDEGLDVQFNSQGLPTSYDSVNVPLGKRAFRGVVEWKDTIQGPAPVRFVRAIRDPGTENFRVTWAVNVTRFEHSAEDASIKVPPSDVPLGTFVQVGLDRGKPFFVGGEAGALQFHINQCVRQLKAFRSTKTN